MAEVRDAKKKLQRATRQCLFMSKAELSPWKKSAWILLVAEKNILTGIIYTIKGTHHLNEETGKTGKDKHWAYKAGLCYLEYGQIVFRACILTKNVLWASILNLFDVDYWSKTSQILKKSITKTCRDTWYTITTRYTLVFLSRLVEDLSLFLWKMSWWEKENIGNGSSCPPCPTSPPNLRKESLRTLLCSSFPFVVVSSFYPYPLHYGPIPIKNCIRDIFPFAPFSKETIVSD